MRKVIRKLFGNTMA